MSEAQIAGILLEFRCPGFLVTFATLADGIFLPWCFQNIPELVAELVRGNAFLWTAQSPGIIGVYRVFIFAKSFASRFSVTPHTTKCPCQLITFFR